MLNRIRSRGRNETHRLEWERRTEPLMLLLALATLPLVLVPELLQLSESAGVWFLVGDIAVWLAFAIDLGIRTWLAEHRVRFLLEHPLEVLIVVLPFLRPLRFLRFARLLRPLMASGLLAQVLRQRAAHWALVSAAIAIVVAAVIAGIVERDTAGGIDDWGTVVWWALATVTTVGYGDVVPVSPIGRVAGVFLMLVGIGVFGVLTANVAAWFVEQDQDKEQEQILAELKTLQAEVKSLREELADTSHED